MKVKQLRPQFPEKAGDLLIDAILSLQTSEEAKNFLRDLMTEEELCECARRIQTAQMLTQKISYSVIEKETGLSSATVARISKWLQNGMGGYKLILNRLNNHHS